MSTHVQIGDPKSGGGGLQPKKKPKKPKKTSPKFEICGGVRFFSVFSVFFGFFFGIFRFFVVLFDFSVLFGFFRSELRQEIPVIQKSCQQLGLRRPRIA